MGIIIFIFSLAVLILVHEFGHFIVAKKSGIRVDEFGLGFPPKLWSKKWGDTVYTLNAIPFGGFVKIFGEDPHIEKITEKDKPTSFFYKPKWVQALVLVAGVVFNVLFAWLLISFGLTLGLPSPVDHSPFGTVTDVKTIITAVLPSSPAEKAGLRAGDSILFASSGPLAVQTVTPEKISTLIADSRTKDVALLIKRGEEQTRTIFVTPGIDVVKDKRAIGIAMDEIGILKLPWYTALLEGARTTGLLVVSTAQGLGTFFWNILTLQSDFSQVSGPIGIAGTVSQAQHLGLVYVLSLVALISINLAVINLVPFPALDGGRLLFVLIEAIIRRPIPSGFVRWTNAIGFVILIVLMFVISGHDIMRLL